MVFNCINEFFGDWNWSCEGFVKLGFRNFFFCNDGFGFLVVRVVVSVVWVCFVVFYGRLLI